ncbi:MAG: FAD-binding monooxygenase [Chloroflexaceae bacterium]|nr:FAD-binding monooxygenase [Chloroflexaceae bacterium]
MQPHVAVIGAGPGGLALAIALHRRAIPVQVYEQAHALRPIGAGLSLMPNGLHALAAIDPAIVTMLTTHGNSLQAVNLWRSSGEHIARTPITYQETYGQPMLLLRWSTLQTTLASFLPAEQVHLNHRCTGLTHHDQGVTVHVEAGHTIEANLVIGADGINSTVRQCILGDGPPHHTGRISWRAILSYQHPMLPADEAVFLVAPDRNILIVRIGEGDIFWSATARADTALNDDLNARTIKERVLAAYTGWAEAVPAIIAATEPQVIIERPICDRPPGPTWSTTHATLLGDAAHPMVPTLGQGANTAFEDAYELAECIVHAPTIADALSAYEQRRVQRTQMIQVRSALQGQRSYGQEMNTVLRGILAQAQMDQSAFDRWLYTYPPPAQQDA